MAVFQVNLGCPVLLWFYSQLVPEENLGISDAGFVMDHRPTCHVTQAVSRH